MANFYHPKSFTSQPTAQPECLPQRRKRKSVLEQSEPKQSNFLDRYDPLTLLRVILIENIFSFPPELRNQISRELLVQPCKFDMEHNSPCDFLHSSKPESCSRYDCIWHDRYAPYAPAGNGTAIHRSGCSNGKRAASGQTHSGTRISATFATGINLAREESTVHEESRVSLCAAEESACPDDQPTHAR